MATVFGDGVAAIANDLRARLSDRGESYAQGVTVATRTPSDREPHNGPTPLVVVSQDGPGTIQQAANARTVIRLAVWHATDDDAHDLAALCHGLATDHRGPVVRAVLPGTSAVRATDPDTGEPMAWATVRALLAPRVV
ncbi:hypothetical protein [Nocardioides nanhaiensis]|uniref:DUF3168 domain-containing protein n=1 Tax=Nocardioides nanhaiensis TaxID=1476871 RepID=A0ABP8W6L7_9ACTN